MERQTSNDAWAIWEKTGASMRLVDSDGFCPQLLATLKQGVDLNGNTYLAQFMRGDREDETFELDNAADVDGASVHMFTHMMAAKTHDRITGAVTGARCVYMVAA